MNKGLLSLLWIGLLVVIAGNVMHLLSLRSTAPAEATVVVTTDTIHDTLYIDRPVVVESVRVRVDTVLLPLVVAPTDTLTVVEPVAVEVPIDQNRFEGDGWQAWVSGYRPALDSLHIERNTITIDREVTRWRQKHWGVSVGIGLGVDRRGHVTPGAYVGIGYQFAVF